MTNFRNFLLTNWFNYTRQNLPNLNSMPIKNWTTYYTKGGFVNYDETLYWEHIQDFYDDEFLEHFSRNQEISLITQYMINLRENQELFSLFYDTSLLNLHQIHIGHLVLSWKLQDTMLKYSQDIDTLQKYYLANLIKLQALWRGYDLRWAYPITIFKKD